MRSRLAVMLVVAAATGSLRCSQQTAVDTSTRVLDLGHPLSDSDPSWNGQRVFSWEQVASIGKDGYFAGKFSSEEHFGTHVDAPAHFTAGGVTVDQIRADRLVRPGRCINVASSVATNDDFLVRVVDIEAYERAHGRINNGDIVFVATGWDARWPDRARYMNERGGVKHFPGLSAEAATFLARDRRVAAIGIDTPSIDYGPSSAFEAHHITMPLGVYHVENAAHLTTLPADGFTVVVAPINLKGGSGGPTRVFALR